MLYRSIILLESNRQLFNYFLKIERVENHSISRHKLFYDLIKSGTWIDFSMKFEKRIAYLTYLIIGFIFIVAGLAINEQNILSDAFNSTPEDWYQFLMPWLGDSENGIPVPWEE